MSGSLLFDINTSKSYKTVENLEKALTKLGILEHRFLLVYTKDGRVTAVFPVSNIKDGDMTRYARHGFMTLG